jgi:hypothetical protein
MISNLLIGLLVLLQAGSGPQVVEEKYPNGAIKSRREVIASSSGEAINHGVA